MYTCHHYKLLQIQQTASARDIKLAFIKKIREHAPDRGGNTEMYNKVLEAYRTLSCPEKKKAYDHYLKEKASFDAFCQSFREIRQYVNSYQKSELSKGLHSVGGYAACTLLAALLACNEYEYSAYMFVLAGLSFLCFALTKISRVHQQKKTETETYRKFRDILVENHERDKEISRKFTPKLMWNQ